MIKLSNFGTYLIGPGSNAPGRNRLNAKLSCSNIDTVPSMDCTHRKSLAETSQDVNHYLKQKHSNALGNIT